MLRHRAVGDSEAPEQDSNIVYTASILYLFIIGRNLSTKQTLAAARTQAGESADRCRHGMPSGYNARDPFFGPCWRYACLPVLTLGIQCPGDAVTTMLLDRYQTDRA